MPLGVVGAVLVLAGCFPVEGAPTAESAPVVPTMKPVSVGEFESAAEALPAELVYAIARDLGISGSEYLANSAAAAMAEPVVEYLSTKGVDPEAVYLEGTELRVLSGAKESLVRSVGATTTANAFQPQVGSTKPVIAPVSNIRMSAEGTDFRGGLPFGAPVDSSFTPTCTVGVNGYRQSDGLKEFITAGDCVASNPGPYSVADVTTAGSVGVEAEPLGAAESGAGLSEPDGIAVIEAGAAVTPRPQVATWGGGMGAPEAGTPIEVRDAIAPVVGAALCKSAPQTGWTCGSITQIGTGQADDDDTKFETFIANVCVMPGEAGAPAMSGNSFVGVVSVSSWSDTCITADQSAPVLYTSFISYKSTAGRPSIDSTIGAVWEPAVNVATPSFDAQPAGSRWQLYGSVSGGNVRHKVHIWIDEATTPIVVAVSSTGAYSYTYSGDLSGTHTYKVQGKWGNWSASATDTKVIGPASPITPDDVVVVTTGSMAAYRATGSGSLSSEPEVVGTGFSSLKSFFVTDWNNDDTQDLIKQWADGRLEYSQGDPDGGYALPVQIGVGWQGLSITIGPWKTADAFPSIVAMNVAGDLYHFANPTGGSLEPGTLIGTGWSGLGITQIDFDQDGKQDILAKTADGALRLYRSNGAGAFITETRATVGTGWTIINSISPSHGFTGAGSTGLMARTTTGALKYYPIQAGGVWGTTVTLPQDWTGRLFAGVPTSNGFPAELNPADVLAVGTQNELLRYRATGAGAVVSGVQIGSAWGGLQAAFVTDWNRDGVQDIVAQWTDGRLSLYPGVKGGGIASPLQIGSGWQDYSITVGPWDKGLQNPSIIARNSAGQLFHYPNLTGGALNERTLIGTGWSGLAITQIDFDRDGNQDIIARGTDGTLRLYRSGGDGEFITEARPIIATGWTSTTSTTATAGFAGPDTLGLITRTSAGILRYNPINIGSSWGAASSIGSGWNGFFIFGSSAQ
ncbi:VCBS repeat-containing protein [Streptomyces sp. ISL-90]|nr:VCBS repeat-containing protein [Streptomyces sp. ISL-90]